MKPLPGSLKHPGPQIFFFGDPPFDPNSLKVVPHLLSHTCTHAPTHTHVMHKNISTQFGPLHVLLDPDEPVTTVTVASKMTTNIHKYGCVYRLICFYARGEGDCWTFIYGGGRCRGRVLTCRRRAFHNREGSENLRHDPEMLVQELARRDALVSPTVGINQANEQKACFVSSIHQSHER